MKLVAVPVGESTHAHIDGYLKQFCVYVYQAFRMYGDVSDWCRMCVRECRRIQVYIFFRIRIEFDVGQVQWLQCNGSVQWWVPADGEEAKYHLQIGWAYISVDRFDALFLQLGIGKLVCLK